MGGNAIADARRIGREEYESIIAELRNLLPELKFEPVKAYFNKKDFGDIDLVTETDPTSNLKDLIRSRLNVTTEYDNGPFFSVSYSGVQVDFIFMSPTEFETALNYFHWNDLGNFIGRVARSVNFKYGHDGLSYDKHYSDHYKISVHVSSDIRKILEFLGYNYEKWSDGFADKEDIFEFAMQTPYFNSTYFSLEEQAHNDRVRNKKRKMYQAFLEFLKVKKVEPKPKLSQEERDIHYQRAIDIFGNEFDLKVKEAQAKYNKLLEVKKLFNGDIVSAHTGLTGKELGMFMRDIKTSEIDFEDKVIVGGTSYVNEVIGRYWRKL